MSEKKLGLVGLMGLIMASISLPGILGGIYLLDSHSSAEDRIIGWVILALAILIVGSSFGLIMRQKWGRMVLLVLLWAALAGISTLGVLLFYYMGRDTNSTDLLGQIGLLIGSLAFIISGILFLNHVVVREELGMERKEE